MNLYPVDYTGDSPRLFALVTGVGGVSTNIALAYDTGSAGITINALKVFPTDMVGPSGFVFPPGQASLNYNGITVTNQQGTRSYGGATGSTEIGNIGYATVSFGDAAGMLTTSTMPIFFFYSVVNTNGGGQYPTRTHQGWFGVNSGADLTVVPNSPAPAPGYPVCAPGVQGSCLTVSALKYLQYGPQVRAGFQLGPATLQQCDITQAGACTPEPILTIGVNDANEAAFTQQTLVCPPAGYSGEEIASGYLVCDPFIHNVTFTIINSGTYTLHESVLFDSGNPAMVIGQDSNNATQISSPLSAGTVVSLVTPSGFTFGYVAGSSGDTGTTVPQNVSAGIGIDFFTTHSFFIDYVANTAGWM